MTLLNRFLTKLEESERIYAEDIEFFKKHGKVNSAIALQKEQDDMISDSLRNIVSEEDSVFFE